MGYAKVTLLGNLVRDPETRHTQGGKSVTNFTLAVNRKIGDDRNGNARESVAFIDVAIWGPRGDAFARFHRKGSLAFVAGDLIQDEWDDKKTGEKRSKLKVTAWEWEFVGGKSNGGGSSGGQSSQPDAFTSQVASDFGDVDSTPF